MCSAPKVEKPDMKPPPMPVPPPVAPIADAAADSADADALALRRRRSIIFGGALGRRPGPIQANR